MKLQFGENFKRLRKEKEVTQEKLSEVLGVSCQSVSRWESGVCYPDVELLPTIANYFGVTVDRLLSNDSLSKEADKKLFYDKLVELEYGSEDVLKLIKSYCDKYPEDQQYKWHFVYMAAYFILNSKENHSDVYGLLKKYVEQLKESKYRDGAIGQMINACDESELDDWLTLVPFDTTHNRRGCLVNRYSRRRGNDYEMYIQQGLENFEKFAAQLDRRYPDTFGPERKAKHHVKVMNIIKSFGDGVEPPDAWKIFYAYKQLVYAACLFAQGKTDEGWQNFESAVEKYKSVYLSDEEYFDLGGEFFSNLKINKMWTTAVDLDGKEYELFNVKQYSFYDAGYLYGLLTNPRWAWFNSAKNDERYVAVVKWLDEENQKSENE